MLKRNLVAVLVAALGITAGAAAFANAQEEQPPPSQQQEQQRPGKERAEGRRGHHPMGRAVHGDLIVRNGEGQFEEVTFDKGTIESIDADSITVARPDGPEVTLELNDDTRYRGVESREQLAAGQRVLVVSKDGVATQVAAPKERGPRRQ